MTTPPGTVSGESLNLTSLRFLGRKVCQVAENQWKSARSSICCRLVLDSFGRRFRRLWQSPESARSTGGCELSSTRGNSPSRPDSFPRAVQHRRSTLQQRARPNSDFYGNAGKEIPGLTRRSGINGKRNSLFCLILGPVINGNTTAVVHRGASG